MRAVDPCSSTRITMAAFLINTLLAFPACSDGKISLDFQFVEWSKLKILLLFIPNLSGVFLNLHGAGGSLMSSNTCLRSSQNRVIYTWIKLYTGGLLVTN